MARLPSGPPCWMEGATGFPSMSNMLMLRFVVTWFGLLGAGGRVGGRGIRWTLGGVACHMQIQLIYLLTYHHELLVHCRWRRGEEEMDGGRGSVAHRSINQSINRRAHRPNHAPSPLLSAGARVPWLCALNQLNRPLAVVVGPFCHLLLPLPGAAAAGARKQAAASRPAWRRGRDRMLSKPCMD